MDYSEKEILIAEQLKLAGLPWRPRQGDVYADGNLHVHLVTKEEADRLVHSVDYLASDRIWLPSWRHCREHLHKLGYTLRDHSEDEEIDSQGQSSIVVGVAVDSKHRGRHAAEGATDLEAIYELLFRVIKSSAEEKVVAGRSGRVIGKICKICNSVMKLQELGGSWQYVCESCSRAGAPA